jgi:hypothetical protein
MRVRCTAPTVSITFPSPLNLPRDACFGSERLLHRQEVLEGL